VLADPASFPSGLYANKRGQSVYKSFDLSGNNVATLSFSTPIFHTAGDFLDINYRSSGGDPFAAAFFLDSGNGTTGGIVGPLSYDFPLASAPPAPWVFSC